MSQEATPARMRDMIVERLTGATGDPQRVVEAGTACAERVLAALMAPLTDAFGGQVTVELADVETARFGDVRPRPEDFGAMTVVSAESSPDALLLCLEADAIALAVSAYFGGDPGHKLVRINRPLSVIEKEVVAQLFDMFAAAFNGSGNRAFKIRQPIPRPVSGPELAKQVLRDGPAVRIRFALVFGENRCDLNIMIPQRVLLSLRGEVSPKQATQPAKWRARFSEEIMRSTVRLDATVPLKRMTLGEIAALQPGQIIELPEQAQTNTRLSAGDKALFTCEFGKLGANYTVRVAQPFDAEQDLVESLLSE